MALSALEIGLKGGDDASGPRALRVWTPFCAAGGAGEEWMRLQ